MKKQTKTKRETTYTCIHVFYYKIRYIIYIWDRRRLITVRILFVTFIVLLNIPGKTSGQEETKENALSIIQLLELYGNELLYSIVVL
jgi:hypothetical protein